MTPVERIRLERDVRHLHELGPRAVFELLIEFAEQADAHGDLFKLLTSYRRVTPAILQALGGDRFPRRSPRRLPAELLRRAG